jgi:hypothetical protein
MCLRQYGSLDSIAGIVTRLQAGQPRFVVKLLAEARDISPPKHPNWLWGAPSFNFNG